MGRDFSRFSLSSNVTRLARLIRGGVVVNRREGERRRERRGRLVSQMAGLLVWAAWRGEGLSHLSEQWPRAHRATELQSADLITRDLILF